MVNIEYAEIGIMFIGLAEVDPTVAGAVAGFDESDVAFDWEDFAFDEE